MGSDVGHRQLGDFLAEGPEAFVFLDPCAYLRFEVLGYVHGPGLPLFLEGQVPAEVFLSFLACAPGFAARVGDLDEAGDEEGALGPHEAEAVVEHATDEGGVLRDVHEGLRATGVAVRRGRVRRR